MTSTCSGSAAASRRMACAIVLPEGTSLRRIAPYGTKESRRMPVGIATAEGGMSGDATMFMTPGRSLPPSRLVMAPAAPSASTSSTGRAPLDAIPAARLRATKLLPSCFSALATSTMRRRAEGSTFNSSMQRRTW